MTPEGWEAVELSDVISELRSGQSPNCASYPAEPGEWGILKTTAITWERGWSPHQNKAILPAFELKPELEVKPGDVLVTKAGPIHRVGVVALVSETPPRLMISGKMTRLRVDRDRCAASFLARALAGTAAQNHLVNRTTGMAASQTNFTHKTLLATPILLPPLREQRKIAAILSSVDAVIEKTAAVIEQLQVVKKAMMQELLTRGVPGRHTRFKQTEMGEIPEEWEVVTLASIATKITDGEHQTPKRQANGVLLLSARNVRYGFLDLKKVDYVGEAEYERIAKRCLPECDDLLISCSGTIGRVCRVPHGMRFGLVRSVALVKPRRDLVSPSFLEQALRGPGLQEQMHLAKRQAAQANLFQGPIRSLLVGLPSFSEQGEIGERLSQVDKRLEAENDYRSQLSQVKFALMSVLLTGEVRVIGEDAA